MTKSLFFSLIIGLLLASCTVPTEQGNRFQVSSTKTSSTTGPVAELHRNAIAALDNENSNQSIEYLQRAIRIEPRNPFSWHYLAQSYWQAGDYAKCLAMIDRSYSYSRPADNLDGENQALKQKCR